MVQSLRDISEYIQTKESNNYSLKLIEPDLTEHEHFLKERVSFLCPGVTQKWKPVTPQTIKRQQKLVLLQLKNSAKSKLEKINGLFFFGNNYEFLRIVNFHDHIFLISTEALIQKRRN